MAFALDRRRGNRFQPNHTSDRSLHDTARIIHTTGRHDGRHRAFLFP